jgi:predicted SAM-dependent methyltransferase
MKLNIGCGASPIPGWVNVDNSLSLYLANHSVIDYLLRKLRLLNHEQIKLINFFKQNNVIYSKATHLPINENSASVVYSSHMMEHLDQQDALIFLHETMRVLIDGGVIRLCLPDIHKLCKNYLEHGDADFFIEQTLLATPSQKSFFHKLKFFIIGHRHHMWMYDAKSLARLLLKVGFRNIRVLKAGETGLLNDGEGINLFEHCDHSFYVEAVK